VFSRHHVSFGLSGLECVRFKRDTPLRTADPSHHAQAAAGDDSRFPFSASHVFFFFIPASGVVAVDDLAGEAV